MARTTSLRFAVLATLCLSLAGLVSAHPNPAPTTTVWSGQSIQSAIELAKPGATILVKKGIYREQLTIKKDGIALIGEQGTVLKPPTHQIPANKQNDCYSTAGTGKIAGICVAGAGISFGTTADENGEHTKVTSVAQRVKGVSITGFEVRGFSGENIALYGAEDACVTDNKLVNGGRYGFLTAGSKNTDFRGNNVYSTGLVDGAFRFIATCSDNESGATVWANDIDGYQYGICVQTNSANIQHNHVTNACYGIFIDPAVDGAIIRHNTIGPSSPDCATAKNAGTGSGIVLLSTTNTQVKFNRIKGQTLGSAKSPTNVGAGILILDAAPGLLATGNQVIRNELSGNDVDIVNISTGSGNVIKKNSCGSADTTFPAGSTSYCSGDDG